MCVLFVFAGLFVCLCLPVRLCLCLVACVRACLFVCLWLRVCVRVLLFAVCVSRNVGAACLCLFVCSRA